ncbi:MAG: lysylphosphatidylglycerol synthase transmembrane domain-containing protein, partial [Flavobacteriaceae bacterium]
MGVTFKKALKTIIPIILGGLLIWYVYQHTSEADRKEIIKNISSADPFWIGVSICIGILSHISRAIRWNYLLKPMGYSPKVSNNFFMVMIAYLANLGIPRSGEFLRATALTSYEGVPFEKGFGTIVTERIVDVFMLLLIILVALVLQTDIIMGYLKNYGVNLAVSIALLVAGILGLVFFLHLIKKAKSGFLLKLKVFLAGLLDGVASILKMEKKGGFILHTLFIWACYIGMFWAIKYTVTETH